jgi:hypothetical protein
LRHRGQEVRDTTRVLVLALATAAERGGVLVVEVLGDERGDGIGIPRAERRDVGDDGVSC